MWGDLRLIRLFPSEQNQEADPRDPLHVPAVRHQQAEVDRAATDERGPTRPRGGRRRLVLHPTVR